MAAAIQESAAIEGDAKTSVLMVYLLLAAAAVESL